MSEFFAMGGYAAYVWSAFGFAFVVLLGLFVLSWRAARQRESEFEELRHLVRPTAGSTLRPRAAARGRDSAPDTGVGAQAGE